MPRATLAEMAQKERDFILKLKPSLNLANPEIGGTGSPPKAVKGLHFYTGEKIELPSIEGAGRYFQVSGGTIKKAILKKRALHGAWLLSFIDQPINPADFYAVTGKPEK